MPNLCRTLQKNVCTQHIHLTLLVLEILVNCNQATRISGAAFFKHKYLTNPPVTPEDLVIAAAENLTQALETSIP
jgi:hypothetical protein